MVIVVTATALEVNIMEFGDDYEGRGDEFEIHCTHYRSGSDGCGNRGGDDYGVIMRMTMEVVAIMEVTAEVDCC
ncbi:hypothetical protein F2Q70_00031408 [Brassica cretica]|uniref:Uncharacterized protein n=2 Tax=Brassica cretica TaxID=69181 RepID=A0A8S9FH72_BRACR|nr:hypothetical protein F2Q70_00031408 [Brassica cretica]KAF2550049.1 hypothetical protein F2Q68_00035819 [Brassica cretica]KAF3592430.1 hypothetical protein DY000_02024588 [Brassica cretica]